ncbi:MAG: hypothetical protein JWO83_1925 [Caulobacteraceae bacterium]|nr:hypothetical protein [Caulobacteraceae bacterium]
MRTLAYLAIIALGTLVVGGAAIVVHARVGMSTGDALAFAALIGAVATVVTLVTQLPRIRCSVANPYLSISQPPSDDFIHIKMEAVIANSGDKRDTLLKVSHRFFTSGGTMIPLNLIFGARDLTAERGHILPFMIEPGDTIFTEGSDHILDQNPVAVFLRNRPIGELILRCRFSFQNSRAQTVYLRPHDTVPLDGRSVFLPQLRLIWLSVVAPAAP